MLSFWEKRHLIETDILIVGAGITGLSVAASIKERWPNRQVTVLERSVFPYGASTRNAGFACFGSLSEIVSDINLMGSEAARELLFHRWIGLKITRQRLTDKAIGFQPLGGLELIDKSRLDYIDRIQEINDLVGDFIPDYLSILDLNADYGLKKQPNTRLVGMRDEGQLDTGLLMKSLEEYVLQLGVKIRSGAQVIDATKQNDTYAMCIRDGHRGEFSMHARQVVITTNAFSNDLSIQEDVRPGRGQVFITKPISKLKFSGNLHLDEGYYYLRNVDDRLLFGGGRNLDFDKETSTQFELNPEIQNHLEDKLNKLLILDKVVEVDMRWSGIMAFGSDKIPIVKKDDMGRILAIKMGGMGIALAGQIGEMVTDLLIENNV